MRDIGQQIRDTRPNARDVSSPDPDRIQQRAHRRDLRDRAALTGASVCAVAVAVAVIGPGGPPSVHIETLGAATETPAALTAGEASRLLDGVIARASLGVPEGQWDEVEQRTVECMAAQGHDYTPVPYPDTTGEPAEQRWDLASADTFNGAQWPRATGSQPHPAISDHPATTGLTGDELQAYLRALIGRDPTTTPAVEADRMDLRDGSTVTVPSGCVGQARHEILDDADATARLAAEMIILDLQRRQQVESHPAAASAMDAWSACLADAGVEPTVRNDNGDLISDMPADQRANLAQECAQTANLLPTLVGVDHDISLRLYEAHRKDVQTAATTFGR